ncbi:hypothetical protein [Microbulbifer taiwanensis]|uniref:Baseplate J/gp47 family protein n=1 Tax=Microbulbifer taiwanensis TaxID=986746 RepID=A0ABW1YIT1_9GAMM|nr:hypothetical protein [Microbulbifer taiwanensis]
MPIELPNLDDIDYEELVSGAIAALPGYGSDWTDYNPSDPGITLLEMLAWLTEMLVYRTNRIQPRTYKAFLQLLMGYGESALRGGTADLVAGDLQETLDQRFDAEPAQAMRDVLLALRRRYRAVTAADYEQLALTTFPAMQQAGQGAASSQIERLACLPEVDVTDTSAGLPADSPGAISLVVLPVRSDGDPSPWLQPSGELVAALGDFFENRRLATTRVCIAGPRYVGLDAAATLYIDGDARPREVLLEARRALFEYLHPVRGGADGTGWPFGRTVYSSELTARLATLAGISHVEEVSVANGGAGGESVSLDGDQLPQLRRDAIDLTVMVLSGSVGQDGSEWVRWNPEVTAG